MVVGILSRAAANQSEPLVVGINLRNEVNDSEKHVRFFCDLTNGAFHAVFWS